MKIIGLHKSFGKNRVLDDVNVEIPDGCITAVLGPNGSGKTTLIKSILGMVIPDKGEIMMDGRKVKGEHAYRKDIGYLPQIAHFPENLKVKELIRMMKDIRNQEAEEGKYIDLFELGSFLNKPLRHLSGGTRQKINIMLAMMFGSRYLILDEPTAGLDPLALIHFKEMLRVEKDKGKTILLSTHIVNLVEEMADEIIFLLEGKVYFQGKLSALKSQQGQQNLEYAIANILKAKAHV